MQRPFRFSLLLVVVLLAVGACDSSRKQIVGKWKAGDPSGEVIWEFFSNGSLTTGGTQGRYSFGDGKRIKIQTPSATFVNQLEFQADRMIWTDQRGTRMEFTRVK